MPSPFQMSQRHHRHSPSHSLRLQALHTLPLLLCWVLWWDPTPQRLCVVSVSVSGVVFLSRSHGGAQQLRLVCSGLHSAHSLLVVVPCQGQRGGRGEPTFGTQALSVVVPKRQDVLWLWCSIHHVRSTCLVSLGNHKTNNNTPAAEEDLFLPPG